MNWKDEFMRRNVARWGAVGAATGLVMLVVGTFLPWLRSGTVLRDSYQSVGALRRLADPGTGPVGALLDAWLVVVPACALCVALYAVGLRRMSAGASCVVAAAVGTAAGLLAVQPSNANAPVGVVSTGPVVTLVGATIGLLGAISVLVGPPGGPRTMEGSP